MNSSGSPSVFSISSTFRPSDLASFPASARAFFRTRSIEATASSAWGWENGSTAPEICVLPRTVTTRAAILSHCRGQLLARTESVNAVDPLPGKIDEKIDVWRKGFFSVVSHRVSKRPIWLGDAAALEARLSPLVARNPFSRPQSYYARLLFLLSGGRVPSAVRGRWELIRGGSYPCPAPEALR